MIVRTLDQINGTDRDVTGNDRNVREGTWRSRRLVLADEKVGFSLHDTVLYAGTETSMWYANHIEAVYVIEGKGELLDAETGMTYPLAPGTVYVLDGHERHTVRAFTDVRTVCVFNPPVTGREIHDENGVYPLLTDDEPINGATGGFGTRPKGGLTPGAPGTTGTEPTTPTEPTTEEGR